MQNGSTALAFATLAGYANIARLLLENGAIMDFEDEVRRADEIKIMILYATVLCHGCSIMTNQIALEFYC